MSNSDNLTNAALEKGSLVDSEAGLVSRKIFTDREIYREELEKIFTRNWLFLGHESQLENSGDFFTNYMGEDPVIVCRDKLGNINAYLNSCQHRGMKVCRLDAGNAKSFTCPYHGWSYDINGDLVAVPFEEQAYRGQLDRKRWGLVKVPRLENHAGFMFGCWDEDAVPLSDFLGDLRFYLDIFIERALGGLESVHGRQRYECKANWKIPADNFAGDDYHVPWTHGSYMKLGLMPDYASLPNYTVALANGHGIGDISVAGGNYTADLALAERFGKDAIDYVKESHARLQQKLKPLQARIYAFGHGNIFPNFSLNDFSALWPVGLYLWHPKGPQNMEIWQWYLMDRGAPDSIKQIALNQYTHVQSAAGAFGQDDSENFEQVTEATRGVIAQRSNFNYQIGMGMEVNDPEVIDLPGLVGPRFSEHCQRNFYAQWSIQMQDTEND